MIDVTGLDKIESFCKALDLELAALDRGISAWFEGQTKIIFYELVRGTPQYTGDLASNWNYSVGRPDYTYSMLHNRRDLKSMWSFSNVYHRGSEPAVGIAMVKAKAVKPTWRDVVYFANASRDIPGHIQDHPNLGDDVENLRVSIRPINLVNGGVAMIQHILNKYGGVQ